MCRNELPRAYELRDLVADPTKPDAYFSDFNASLQQHPEKKAIWLAREREFQQLDPASWRYLKEEAFPYLARRDPGRGWEQFVAVLNQARAHIYLVDTGCSAVRFVPRGSQSGAQTPDVEGLQGKRRALCEVKTINPSAVEIARREAGQGRSTTASLDCGFFRKLKSTLESARAQLLAYDDSADVRRIAFLVLNFDDSFAEYKANYYAQIDQWLADHSIPGLEVAFYNQCTPCHVSITMQHAQVINEAA